MKRNHKITAIVALAVALAFVMPGSAVANVGTLGVTSNSEITGDMKNMVEISTNSDNSDTSNDNIDNIETTIETTDDVESNAEKSVIDTEESSVVNNVRDIVSTTGNTIEVDDDADPSWYNATHVKTIKEGMDNATNGDTVYVYNGTYNERLTVWKQLYFVGESRENVIVNGFGGGRVFWVRAFYVSFDSLTVTNGQHGIQIWNEAQDITITNCDISHNSYYGIYHGKPGTIITNCNVYNNGEYGIFNSPGTISANITNCDVYNNTRYGIGFFNVPVPCKLRDNTVHDNGFNYAIMGTSVVHYSQDIDLSNTVNGKPMYYLIGQSDLTLDETDDPGYVGLISCTNITVENIDTYGVLVINTTDSTISNVDSHNSQHGIYLRWSPNNSILDCNVYYNGVNGIYYMEQSDNNIIMNCNAYDNRLTNVGEGGIYIESSSYNDIINCNVYNQTKHGLHLSHDSSHNNVINCDVFDNNNHGIFIRYAGASYNNIINCNSYNNGKDGINANMGSNNNITNCNSYDNGFYGIKLITGQNNIVTNCTVYNNKNGIIIQNPTASNNGIINCTVYNNSANGIHNGGAPNTDIINCEVYNNGYYGISLASCSNSKLEDNTMYDNLQGNFNVDGSIVDHFYHDIDISNTVDGERIYYLIEQSDLVLGSSFSSFGYLALISCTNITAMNSDVAGIFIINTTDSTISNVDSRYTAYGVYLWFSSNNNITNCDVYNNTYGILSTDSSNNNIVNCEAYNNTYGIKFDYSSNNKLEGNLLYDNTYNFAIWGTDIIQYAHDISPTNTVDGKPIYYIVEQENLAFDETSNIGYLGLISCTNITVENSDVTGILMINTTDSTISNVDSHNSAMGIYLYQSSYNDIINCNAYDNGQSGIYLTSSSGQNNITNCDAYSNTNGIWLTSSNGNNIMNCDAYDNSQFGIRLTTWSWANSITNCNAYNNGMWGILLNDHAQYTTITNCDAYNNNYGIQVQSSSFNWFTNCKSYSNTQDGWSFYYAANNNDVINCDIYDNAGTGIYFYYYCKNNFVHHCNIVNNGYNAYDDYTSGNQWDDGSMGNYYSDYTGVDEDGDGIGDTPYIIWDNSQDNYPLMLPLDTIPPVITDITATPEVQNTTEPVNITFMVTDNWDMIDTVKLHIDGPEGFTLEITMNESSYYYEDIYTTMGIYFYYIWANDTQGNIAISDTYSFTISDIDAPMSAVAPLPTWKKNIPFTVTATASDPTFSPGVANVTLWSRYSTDGTNWTDNTSYGTDEELPWSWSFTGNEGYYEFYSIAIDDYGNVEDPPSTADASTGLDTTKPVTTIVLDGTMGENDWYVSNVTVTLSPSDALSGIDSTWYRLDSGIWKFYGGSPFTVSSEGDHTVEYYSFDIAGNGEDTKSVSFKIDMTPPATTYSFDGVIGEDGWYVSDVTVTLTASDATSGVNYTKYKLNDGNWIIYTDPFDVTEDGEYTLYYYSVDLAGNIEPTNEVEFKIDHDTDPPVTTHDFEGIMGDNDWFTSNVVVVLTAEDDSAGVDYTMYKLEDDTEWQEYTVPIFVTEDGEYTLYYYSVDKVGNEETVKGPFDFDIDQTVPTINLTWDEENSKLVADVDDETSGVAKVEFYVNGEYVGEATTSPYEWEVTNPRTGDTGQAIVYDNAGNQAISGEIDAVSQSQPQSSSSTPVQQILSWLLGLW